MELMLLFFLGFAVITIVLMISSLISFLFSDDLAMVLFEVAGVSWILAVISGVICLICVVSRAMS